MTVANSQTLVQCPWVIVLQKNAYAKLNLVLGITGTRADGYHLLDTVFCPIDLCDTLSVRKKPDKGLSLTCTDDTLCGADNLVLRAARLFSKHTGIPLSLHFHLDKRIPVQSGLGGGSADAAAALLLLDDLYPGAATKRALLVMALDLGADVPYALVGGMQRARGIGERLTPIPDVPPLHFVILKPEEGLSTPAVFGAYDAGGRAIQPDVDAAVCALTNGDLSAFSAHAGNALQKAAQTLCPSIGSLCTLLKTQGARYAAMTGSGSAVFGLFSDYTAAQHAADALKDCAPFCTIAQCGC